MNVLVVTNMYPTDAEPWFGCFVEEQVEDLRALGIGVTVLPFDGRHDRGNYLRAAGELRRLARGDFDLVHAHYGLTGAVALAQRRLPTLTTFHGSDTGYVRWQARVSWVVARLTTPIFVEAGGAERLGLPGAAVLPMGVDTGRFRPWDRGAARAELGWDLERPYVLFPASRENPHKSPELFDAVVEEAGRALPGLVGVALGRRSRDEVARMMAAVDATIVTSRFEGSAVVVRESLACNTPVVSVRVGDAPTVLAGLPGCEVCERDPQALAAAVARALPHKGSPLLRRRAERSSRPRVAERLVEIYRAVAS
jgi:glycosyltransferase involved in cell wall biosynthesis